MQRKVLLAIAIMFMVGTVANAVTLEVGSGKTYATIQAAIDVCYGGQIAYGDRPNDTLGETIIVYPGSYAGFNMPAGYDCMTVKAAVHPLNQTSASQRTIITGTCSNNYTAAASASEGSLYEGFYVNSTHATSAVLQTYGRMNTWSHMIIYSGAGTNAAIYGYSQWGQEVYENATVYDMGYPYSEGYMSQLNINDSIVANCDNEGVGTAYSNIKGDSGGYNIFYSNGTGDYGTYVSDATDKNVDPVFASTNPADDNFLWLGASSPGLGNDRDGINRGALAPEPATLALLGLAGAFVLRRRRS
jgi:hypothetical protein